MLEKRNREIDIIKGIAIFSIVLGHAFNQYNFHNAWMAVIHDFVYTFHIIIWIYCSGYLFKEKSAKIFLIGKIKSLYIPSIVYMCISLLLYPLFLWLDVIEPLPKEFFIKAIVKTLLFFPSGILMGAMWFVTFYFMVNASYLLIDRVVKKYFANNLPVRYVIVCGLSLIGVMMLCCDKLQQYRIIELLNTYVISRAFLALPFMELGRIAKRKKIHRYIKEYIWVVMLFLILLLNYFSGERIDLADGYIYGGILFYPVTVAGLIFIVSLSKFILKIGKRALLLFLSIIAKYSFHIMAFHFIVFKIIDGVIGKLGIINAKVEQLRLFPYSFPQIWWLYLLLGILIPVGIVHVLSKTKVLLICQRKKSIKFSAQVVNLQDKGEQLDDEK